MIKKIKGFIIKLTLLEFAKGKYKVTLTLTMTITNYLGVLTNR